MKETFAIKQNLSFTELLEATISQWAKSESLGKIFKLILIITSSVFAFAVLQSLLSFFIGNKESILKAGSFLFTSLMPLFIYLFIVLLSCLYVYFATPYRVKNVSYTFNNWGMEKTTQEEKFTRPWRSFLYYRETKSFFLLYISQNDAHIIQKRMFKNKDEVQEFKDFLNDKLL